MTTASKSVVSAASLDAAKLDIETPKLEGGLVQRWGRSLSVDGLGDPGQVQTNLKKILEHVQSHNLQEGQVPAALRKYVHTYLGGFGPPSSGEAAATAGKGSGKGKKAGATPPPPQSELQKEREGRRRVAASQRDQEAKKTKARQEAINKAEKAKGGSNGDKDPALAEVPPPQTTVFVLPFKSLAKTFASMVENEAKKDSEEARSSAMLGLHYKQCSATYVHLKKRVFNKPFDAVQDKEGKNATFQDKDGKKVTIPKDEYLKMQRDLSQKFEEWVRAHGPFVRKQPQTYRRYARIADKLIDADGSFSKETLNRIAEVGTTKIDKILELPDARKILFEGITVVGEGGKKVTTKLEDLSASQLDDVVAATLAMTRGPTEDRTQKNAKAIVKNLKKLRSEWHLIKSAKKAELSQADKVELWGAVELMEEVCEFVKDHYPQQ